MKSNPQLAKSKSMKLAYKEMMKRNKHALLLGNRVLSNKNHLQIWGKTIFKKELIHVILQSQILGWKPDPTKEEPKTEYNFNCKTDTNHSARTSNLDDNSTIATENTQFRKTKEFNIEYNEDEGKDITAQLEEEYGTTKPARITSDSIEAMMIL